MVASRTLIPSVRLRPFFSLLVLSWISLARGDADASYADDVRRVCAHTRFPQDCVNSLLSRRVSMPGGEDFAGVASVLVEKIREEVSPVASMFQLDATEKAGDREVIEYCNELMDMSLRRLNQSMNALAVAPVEKKEDIQTWLSAVLTFQGTCKDSLEEVQNPLSRKMESLFVQSSNALALANRIPQAPATRSSRLPGWVLERHRRLLAGADIMATAVVAADGSGHFTSIKDALAGTASNGGPSVIFLKAGVYREKLSITRDGVTLIGEGKYSTIITQDDSVGGGSSMPNSATVGVFGDGFMAKDIGFENTAGPYRGQALALRVISDRAVFFRCSIRGYQDTLMAQGLRQFYRDCDIQGTIDFIFGNAAAVFQNCDLVFRKPKPGNFNAMLANGRMDPGQNTGFVAQKCNIRASSELYPVRYAVRSYLGRPWKQYSRAVVIQSTIDGFIQSRGWSEWSGGFALSTLYFAEGLNEGSGAGTSGRVGWPGFHVIGSTESSKFTVSNFIQGTSWLPSTGVTYDPGM